MQHCIEQSLGQDPLTLGGVVDVVAVDAGPRSQIGCAQLNEGQRQALNPFANLRMAVMQDHLSQPSADEQKAMEALLVKALEEGAVGFSTGLAYEPGCMAQPAELEGLARVAASKGSLHTSHIRNEGDTVQESVEEVLAKEFSHEPGNPHPGYIEHAAKAV